MPVLPNLPTQGLNKEGMTLLKVKKWSKPKFKEGGPPCSKGLARTLNYGDYCIVSKNTKLARNIMGIRTRGSNDIEVIYVASSYIEWHRA